MENKMSNIEASMKKVASKEFVDFCEQKYPALVSNEPYRNLFFWLAFGARHDKNTGRLLLPHMMLRKFAGEKWSDTHYITGDLLAGFQKDVLPNFKWSEYLEGYNEDGRCRQVIDFGFGSETFAEIRKEKDRTKEVYFANGKTYNKLNKVKYKKIDAVEYEEMKKHFHLNHTQQYIYDILQKDAMDGQAITENMKKNNDLIMMAIENLQPKIDDRLPIEEKKARQYAILDSMKEDPRIFYAPTSLQRTPRLHQSNDCLLGLASDVRKAVCRGWYEADLVSSQFVIFCNLLDCEEGKKVIKSGEPLWNHLNFQLTGNHEKPEKSLKDALKTVIYMMCFGGGKDKMREVLKDKKEILELSLFQEMFACRKAKFRIINADGYIMDVWNQKHYLEAEGYKSNIYDKKEWSKTRWAGSLLATQIQSIEMECIRGVFEWLAKNGKKVKVEVRAFQHDGLCLSFPRAREESIIKSMQQWLNAKAVLVGKSIGIDLSDMKLEVKQLGEEDGNSKTNSK